MYGRARSLRAGCDSHARCREAQATRVRNYGCCLLPSLYFTEYFAAITPLRATSTSPFSIPSSKQLSQRSQDSTSSSAHPHLHHRAVGKHRVPLPAYRSLTGSAPMPMHLKLRLLLSFCALYVHLVEHGEKVKDMIPLLKQQRCPLDHLLRFHFLHPLPILSTISHLHRLSCKIQVH